MPFSTFILYLERVKPCFLYYHKKQFFSSIYFFVFLWQFICPHFCLSSFCASSTMPPLLPSCWLPASCHAVQELTCLISCSCLYLCPPPPPDVPLLSQHQRGSIHTENGPLGRLCKMCNPFFHKFRVISSAKQYSSSAIRFLNPHRGCGLEDWPWSASCSPLQEKRGKGSHDVFSDGSLKAQAAWAEASERAPANSSCW